MLPNLFALFFKPDERFIMHRFRSTRLAMIVGILMMGLWFNYELLINSQWRLDLIIILAAIAITKVGAMIYYHATM